MRFLLILISGVWLTACSQPRHHIERRGNALHLSGVITPAAEKEFARALDASVRIVVLNSVGGDEASAISIASSMLSTKMDVIVSGVCLSSCAQYLFVAGTGKKILRGALVGCHHNSIAAMEVPSREYGSAYSSQEQGRRDAAIQLYRNAGVAIDFAQICMAAAVPLCVCLDPSKRGEKSVVSFWDGWIPLQSDYERLGIANVVGAPIHEKDAMVLAEKHGLFATADAPSRDEAPEVLASTKNCASTTFECKALSRRKR